ncbi:MAG: MFS transporter [Thermoleophilia bacterium]
MSPQEHEPSVAPDPASDHATGHSGADGSAPVPPVEHQDSKAPLWTRGFVMLLLYNLFFFLGFQLLSPTLPVFAVRLGGGAGSAGLVVGFFTLAAVIVRPVTGWALDAYGRYALLAAGTVLTLAVIIGHEWVAAVPLLLALRFAHGATFAVATTAGGTVASDLVPRQRLGEGMGFFTQAMSLPMAVGPVVGLALIASGDFTWLFMLGAGLTAISLLLLLGLRVPLHQRSRRPFGLRVLYERPAMFPSALMLLLTMTYGPVISFIALFAEERNIAGVGLFFTVYAVVQTLIRRVSGRLADRRGYGRMAAVGLVVTAVAVVTIAVSHTLLGVLTAAVLYGIGFGTAQPSLNALAVNRVSPARRGAATAAFFTAFDLGIALGSIGGGLVAAAFSLGAVFVVSALPVLLGALLLFVHDARRRQVVAAPGG